ncbi:MAG: glycosyltransferase family 2 protein [Lachnospiraceae bacterium]|nr:glycosyltransferase family 2 protein [Lachnospiraceae bacterium]
MDLSVIIPACNVQGHIAACLRSVTRCPRENMDMECIVVDDGSTVDTAEVVHRYSERDKRIKLVTKENGGVSDARNKGLQEAAGRYILFLDADDRLCEDAWEQIEAAVKEEYADFVAFSYITLLRSGKLKTRMLPISDVVSTDAAEAKRLMFADSALNTCLGKLFKGAIIRDNNIVFRTDLPVGEEYLFVAEYFEYCSSYMLTKAMIIYYLQRGGSTMRSYSMEEQLGIIKTLYDYDVAAVKRCDGGELVGRMHVYYLKILTNLFYEYTKVNCFNKEALVKAYGRALEDETMNRILGQVDEHLIRSCIERYEYRLLKGGNVGKIRGYFSLKVRL